MRHVKLDEAVGLRMIGALLVLQIPLWLSAICGMLVPLPRIVWIPAFLAWVLIAVVAIALVAMWSGKRTSALVRTPGEVSTARGSYPADFGHPARGQSTDGATCAKPPSELQRRF